MKKNKIIERKTSKISEKFFIENFDQNILYSCKSVFGATNTLDISNCHHREGSLKFGEKYFLMKQIFPNIF